MALAVSSATARWSGTPAVNTDITSAAFTPADNSLLVLCIMANQSFDIEAMTFAVASSGLTWTERVHRDNSDGGGHQVAVAIWTCPITTGASMTVAVRYTAGTSNALAAKCWVVTGQHTSPIGTNGEGTMTTDPNGDFAAFTGTGVGRAFFCASDGNVGGTAITSSGTIDVATVSTWATVVSGYNAANHSAGAVNCNINWEDTPDAQWVALEILEDTGGGGGPAPTTGSVTLTGNSSPMDYKITPKMARKWWPSLGGILVPA